MMIDEDYYDDDFSEEEYGLSWGVRLFRFVWWLCAFGFALVLVAWLLKGIPSFGALVAYCALLALLPLTARRDHQGEVEEE